MIKIIKQEIKINHELKSKVEWDCKLNSTKPIFINGSLLKIRAYQHRLYREIINNKTYLLFNGHGFVYYRDLNTKKLLIIIKLKNVLKLIIF